jgi:hypothetical protein
MFVKCYGFMGFSVLSYAHCDTLIELYNYLKILK